MHNKLEVSSEIQTLERVGYKQGFAAGFSHIAGYARIRLKPVEDLLEAPLKL